MSKENSAKINIIKLGGSILTDKATPYTIRRNRIREIAMEIKEVFNKEKLIVIHGVGSFGHPPVKKYELYKGYKGKENLPFLAQTQSLVFEIRLELTQALQKVGINAMIFLPSSQIVAENMEIKNFFIEPIEGFLKIGMVPVLGGDIVFDRERGFSVCSGDIMAIYLAEKLHAKRVVFATDVEGIYTMDPKENPNAKLISEIKISSLEKVQLSGSKYIDVTKGMAGKIESVRKYAGIVKKGTEVVFLSMMKYGNLKAYMEDREEAKYTKIIK